MQAISKPIVMKRGVRYRDADRMVLIPIKNVATERRALLRKPEWVKIKLPVGFTRIQGIKAAMRKNGLHSICEEASCLNLAECFSHGTAAFTILGAICIRRCPFYDVAHGRSVVPDTNEPLKLAQTIADMALRYVAITPVDRNDLRDSDTQYPADYITAIREKSPPIKIETLVPNLRDRMDRAPNILTTTPPDIFNHNLENVPRIYHSVRSDADYNRSLKLLERFKEAHPEIPTKSGLMVGPGETNMKVIEVVCNLCNYGVTILTLGQYLQPSRHHLLAQRYVSPDEFDGMKVEAIAMGFTHVACGPSVRPSYHAGMQTGRLEVK